MQIKQTKKIQLPDTVIASTSSCLCPHTIYRRHKQNSKAECIPTAGSLLMYCFVQPLHRLFHLCLSYRMAAFQHRFKLQGIASCIHLARHKQVTCSGRCRDTMILSFICQSLVEIEYYSVAYFDRRIYTARLSPALNGSSEIRCFERSDTIEIHNGIIYSISTRDCHIYVRVHIRTTRSLVHTPWPSEELYLFFAAVEKKCFSVIFSMAARKKLHGRPGYEAILLANNYLRSIQQKLVYRFFLLMQHALLVQNHDTQQLQ